jgi:hypothetical protein
LTTDTEPPTFDAMTPRRLALGLVTALLAASTTHAQQRPPPRIFVPGISCRLGWPRRPVEWVVAPDTCPGASLARACAFAFVEGTCPDVTAVADAIGTAELAHCAPSDGLLRAADELYGRDADPARSLVLYRRAALSAGVRSIALYRAAHTAARLAHNAECVALYGELLSETIPGPLRATALRSLALDVLANDDLDVDSIPDAGFPEVRLSPAQLPDAPWARWAALAMLRQLVIESRMDAATLTRAAIARRWPDTDGAAIDAAMRIPEDADGSIDDRAVGRRIAADAFAACAPDPGGAFGVRFTVGTDGAISDVAVTPPGPVGRCIAEVLAQAHAPSAEDGDAMVDGIVLFAPR